MYGTKKSRYILGQKLAIDAVNLAVRNGVLAKASEFKCVDCGKPAKHYEHRDYNMPLDVVPVCIKCNILRGAAIGRVFFEKKHIEALDKIDTKIKERDALRESRIKLRGKSMNIYFYKKSHTKSHLKKLCLLADVKYSWFDLCARNHGELSLKAGINLEAASRVIAEYEGDYMTVEEIFNIEDQVALRQDVIRQSMIKKGLAA